MTNATNYLQAKFKSLNRQPAKQVYVTLYSAACVCPSVCLPACLSVCLSLSSVVVVCLSVSLRATAQVHAFDLCDGYRECELCCICLFVCLFGSLKVSWFGCAYVSPCLQRCVLCFNRSETSSLRKYSARSVFVWFLCLCSSRVCRWGSECVTNESGGRALGY